MKKKSIKVIKTIFLLSSCDENPDGIKIDMKNYSTIELSPEQVESYKLYFSENFEKILDIESKKKEWYEELESKYPKGNAKNEKIRDILIYDFESKQKKLSESENKNKYLDSFFYKRYIPGKIYGNENEIKKKLEDDFRNLFKYSKSNYFPPISENLKLVEKEDLEKKKIKTYPKLG